MKSGFLFATLLAVLALAATAEAGEFQPLKPLDLNAVDKSMIGDIYGPWEVYDKSGKKRCRVNLKKEPAIGGSAIDVSPDCGKLFPVMEDITAWRLLENWTIDFVDALRKTRIRFSTPDERYVAFPETDGITGLGKPRKR